ncbi:MAG: cache domain-containing protein [Ferruginibacter sp.]
MKLFSINKNQAAVLTTLLILVSLGAGYFFIYLPHNEKRIQEQRFSALQNIDRNIHTKIENSNALLNNLLTSYLDTNRQGRQNWVKYITSYPSTNFTLTIPDSIPQKEASKNSSDKDSVYITRVNNDTREIRLLSSKQEPGGKNEKDSGYTITVNNDTREITLLFSKKVAGKKMDTTFRIGMKFSFIQFIKFLLPKDVFDEYIVFSKGRPVYESFPAGISYIKEDSLLGAKNGIGSSGIRNQLISGTDYKMFLQPVGFDANNEWIIGGLLSNKHYQNEKTQLSTQMVLLLVTIMLIGILAFPWLKLYQMGSKDRLTISDGIASIFISMLLISLTFFVFFNYNLPFRPPPANSKLSLANGIYNAFRSEIDTVYHKLKQLDTLEERPDEDLVNINTGLAGADGNKPKKAQEIMNIISGISINQVFWVKKNGAEMNNWSVDSMNGPRGNFRNRGYFKNIMEHRGYRIDGKDTAGFFLDQGISWTTGAFRSVISLRSKRSAPGNDVVAALSFNFKSVDSVVLPTGYLFAIINGSGNVLYHSEPSRNLNENLLNVFSETNKLKSFLDAKAPGTFSTKYYGNDYDVAVKPIDGLPYFIIIFEDAIYKETKDMETYSFTFSMLFLFFGFLVLQLFAIFLVSAKRSFLKKQVFDTSWIGPKISSHPEYVLSALFNCIVIFLLILFFNTGTFLEYLFMLLLSVTFIPLFLTSIFEKKYAKEKIDILQFKRSAKYCLWAFTGIIGIAAFKMLDHLNFIYLACFGLLVIILAVCLYKIKQVVYDAAHQLKISKRGKVLFGKWNYVNSFTLMALTRLIVTSGLPVVFFYISSHNYEQNLSVRYRQDDFARRLLNKYPGISPDSILSVNNTWNGVYYDSSLINHVSVVTREEALRVPGINSYKEEELRAIHLLKQFRLFITDKAIIEDQFDNPGTANSTFFFNHLLKDACEKGEGNIMYSQSSLPDKYLKIRSEDLNYHYPSVFNEGTFNGRVFWLLLAITLFVFYFIIYSIIKKLFSLNLPDIETWNGLDDKILISKNLKEPIFVIGLPGAGKKKYLQDKIKNGEIKMDDDTPLCWDDPYEQKNNVFIAELINIPSSGNEEEEKALWNKYTKKVFDEKNRVIIVNHFEYNIQDSVSNRFKLEFLERLFLEERCKIFILSTIHPVAFLDSALDHTFKPEENSVPGQDLERWHVLLGHYRIVVLPLQLPFVYPKAPFLFGSIIEENDKIGIPDVAIAIIGTPHKTFSLVDGQFILQDFTMPFTIEISSEGYSKTIIPINTREELIDIKLKREPSYQLAELIRIETGHTYFLKNLRAPAFEAGKDLSKEKKIAKPDELAFKLQVSSHYFYMYIWQSLTKEEKFLLYDLAEDNLVNSFDDYNLTMLIAKGVVIRPEGTLKLFNKGFRNFILTAIGNSEAIKIKSRIKENGNWNTLKNPLQLVILAILAFLLISQEEAFGKLITYAAALGAGVPAVLKLFSLFDKNSQKPG